MHWSVPFQALEVLIEQKGQWCEAKGRLLSHSLPSMPLYQGEGLNWLGSPAPVPWPRLMWEPTLDSLPSRGAHLA